MILDVGKRGGAEYSFGLGKKRDPYAFGLGKRSGNDYAFGMGKKDDPYAFGLGKRADRWDFVFCLVTTIYLQIL